MNYNNYSMHMMDSTFVLSTDLDSSTELASPSKPVLLVESTELETTSRTKKLFNCTICNKEFKHRLNLKRHEKTHYSIKTFKCNIYDPKEQNKTCRSTFTRKEDLITHKRVHTGERPYKCIKCDAAFTRNSDWRYHERNHPKSKSI